MIGLTSEQPLEIKSQPQISLVLINGIPGSGKSSLIKKFRSNLSSENSFLDQYNLIIRINFDKIERLLGQDKETNSIFEENGNILKCYGSLDFKPESSERKLLLKEVDILRKLKGLSCKIKSQSPVSVENSEYIYDPNLWRLARSIAKVLCSNFMEAINETNDSTIKALIILDDNFLLQSMRKPYYNLAAVHQTSYAELYIQVALETALARNQTRPEILRVPDDVIGKALEKYQKTKYLNNVVEYENNINITWDMENLLKVWDLVEEKLQIKIEKKDDELTSEEKEKFSKINKESLMHQIDLTLRELIGAIMSGGRKDNASESAYLKELDKESLKKIKNLGKILSSLKKLFLDICSYVYIIIEKDKNFKVSLVDYLTENKTDYGKLVKANTNKLSLDPDFDSFARSLFITIDKSFVSLLEQEEEFESMNATDRMINLLKEKVCLTCTDSLVSILKIEN